MRTASIRAVAAVMAGMTLSAAVSAQLVDNPRSGQSAAAPPGFVQPVERMPRYPDEDSASQTRERFRAVLRQYPPSLAEVLRLDPSLLTDERYLAPYPSVRAFLADHPEIARNASFFVGENWMNWTRNTPSAMRFQLIAGMFAGLAGLVGVIALLFVIAWVTRLLVEHRRWWRVSKVQTDVHNKLLDRFTSNEDLLAYIQTPAGRRFLESAPITVEGAPRSIGAPIARILWSVQAGTVVALVGAGLLVVSGRIASDTTGFADVSPFLFVIAGVLVATGLGFLLSALIAYGLSRRLGLLEPASTSASNA